MKHKHRKNVNRVYSIIKNLGPLHCSRGLKYVRS